MLWFALLFLSGVAENSPRLALEVGAAGERRLMRSKGRAVNIQGSFFQQTGIANLSAAFQCYSGIPSQSACCPASCGTCGGPVCALLEGGSDHCCYANILESKRECSAEVGAPCIIGSGIDPHAACAGIPSIPVCCPAGCGECGGPACSNRPGGSENCCHRAIVGSGRKCSKDTAPPCAMYDESVLHPPATVLATTATTTTTSTTTTTLTSTTSTLTTTTATTTTETTTSTTATGTTTITTTEMARASVATQSP
mmetsp:Transcript_40354/g.93572  ORF Transcript_40354/g.93572 Transcript_40354/m.93572 type:complete len:254 (-) Transcript_40354:104-865(-)